MHINKIYVYCTRSVFCWILININLDALFMDVSCPKGGTQTEDVCKRGAEVNSWTYW